MPRALDALAKRAGLGARTFLRRFVRATGMKPSEYHQRLRIARSRELLEFTRDTVEQVALAVGYEDTSGFRRTFKRVIGLSPAEYRRRFEQSGRGHTQAKETVELGLQASTRLKQQERSGPMPGVGDPRNDPLIDFVDGVRDLAEL